jgi:hypothetical protein
MRVQRINERTLIIILMIAAVMYAIALGAFLFYQWQTGKNKRVQSQVIAECLGSHGHIGPELTCRYDIPPNELEPPQ